MAWWSEAQELSAVPELVNLGGFEVVRASRSR